MTPDSMHKLTPLAVRDRIRRALPPLGIEKVVAEVEKVSNALDAVGAPNITLSVLVTHELTQHLKPPPGWDAEHVEMWKGLPYRLAKYVRDKREQDLKAVRNLQNADAAVKKELARIEAKKAAEQCSP
jgi:hypothetical protein